MIDSRDFLAAKKRADNEVLLPAGPKIAFTGGLDFNDHRLIWDELDKVHAKHPDMVLLHGGSPEGRRTDRRQMGRTTARCRRSPSGPTGRSTPRPRRSSATTRCSTSCRSASCVFPGTGIQDNLADKARKLGIPVWRFRRAARERRDPWVRLRLAGVGRVEVWRGDVRLSMLFPPLSSGGALVAQP